MAAVVSALVVLFFCFPCTSCASGILGAVMWLLIDLVPDRINRKIAHAALLFGRSFSSLFFFALFCLFFRLAGRDAGRRW
jgi:hypothetical protein